MKTKFVKLIDTYHTTLEEQEAPPPESAVPPEGDPGAVPEAPPMDPTPGPQPEPGPQAIEDLTIAGKIALQIDGLTSEDRSMLIEPVTSENAANIRDLLSSIAAKYDVPN
jgi:hypothetical protein